MKIETKRLILREWRPEDLAPFAEINRDPRVTECLPKPLTERETEAMVEKIGKHFKKHGFGLFACEEKESGKWIGFVGLNVPDFQAPFTPCVEIGWRLAFDAWNRGYATEAARATLRAAFGRYELKEIVAFTVPANRRSIRVMEKLGMLRDWRGDFQHPKFPQGHPLSLHVLYRIAKDRFEATARRYHHYGIPTQEKRPDETLNLSN